MLCCRVAAIEAARVYQTFREALDCVVAEVDRAGDIIHRIKDHIKKAPPKMDRFDVNEAIRNAIILARGEVVKIGGSIQTQLAESLPFFRGDRVFNR